MNRYAALLVITVFLAIGSLNSQTFGNIEGVILNQSTNIGISGVEIEIRIGPKKWITISDSVGYFRADSIDSGSCDLYISLFGYKPVALYDQNIKPARSNFNTYYLSEDVYILDSIMITPANTEVVRNEMTFASAKTFLISDAQKYAGSFSDPARIMQNMPGVTSAGDDLSNEIVIRGNSPNYLKWRLDGVEIPSPNHFSRKGSSGGALSLISSKVLGDSDFHTGAFPAEYGNALGGVFNLRFRRPSSQNHELTLKTSILGLEATVEGPLRLGHDKSSTTEDKQNKSATYLINYRYSTLSLLSKVSSLDFGDFQPDYQDLSFQLNFSKSSTTNISAYGIYGRSVSESDFNFQEPVDQFSDLVNFKESNEYGVVGVKYKTLFKDDRTYLSSNIYMTYESNKIREDIIDINSLENTVITDENIIFSDRNMGIYTALYTKVSDFFKIKTGITLKYSFSDYLLQDRFISRNPDFTFSYSDPFDHVSIAPTYFSSESYIQGLYHPSSRISMTFGVNLYTNGLLKDQSVTPKLSIQYKINQRTNLAISIGQYSQAEHSLTYLLTRIDENGQPYLPNRNLTLSKALHTVISLNRVMNQKDKLSIELFYQNLYDLPYDPIFTVRSIINTKDIYSTVLGSRGFFNTGTARNIGIDLSYHKSYKKSYGIIVASLSDSKLKSPNNITSHTRFNYGYSFTTLIGTRLKVRKSHLIDINTRFIFNGGVRYSDIDFSNFLITENNLFALRAPIYQRIDIGTKYVINKSKFTHSFVLEIQNVLNRKNISDRLPDFTNQTYIDQLQNGMVPSIGYEIEF